MALVFINGFDDQMHGTSAFGTAPALTYNTTTPAGRTGTTSLASGFSSVNTGVNFNAYTLPGGGDATVVLGLALQLASSTGTVEFSFRGDGASVQHVTLGFAPASGVLTVYRGSITSAVVIGSATLTGAALLASTWTYWEIKVTLSDTVGEVHVRNNGTAVLDLTGVDTKNGGTGTKIESVTIPQGISNPVQVYTDDLYVVTGTSAPNDFLGDCKVNTIYPTGNGDYSQLVGSDLDSTNNYLLVNEAGAPVTTSYVESDTVGQRDFYAMGDISIPATATILGVQVSAWCNNPDGGTGRSAKLGVRQSTSETLSANQALTAATFLPARGMFTTDPATGAAWSQAGVNSAQAGVEVG